MTTSEDRPDPTSTEPSAPPAPPAKAGGGAEMQRFSYDDAIVRKFAWATVVWGVVATLAGLVIAIQLVLPSAIDRFPGLLGWLGFLLEVPQLTFGRLRPLHTNAAIFAFAGNSIFAAIYYSTQRLCKARMWSDKLSNLHFWGWQLIIVSAALTLPFGITQGKEYAELEWPIDLAIAVVWVAFFGVNFLMTLVRRRERHMYVALWFYIATIVTVAVLHVFNNLWVPAGLVHWASTGELPSYSLMMKSYPIYAGVQDALMQWWYGHNAVAFFLTTPFLGLMYYFLPKAAERPVFSYKLSIIHFWSLVFIYIWAGPHHLHYTALPEWASTMGMVFSVMLWMPSWGGMINGLLTLRGAWHKVAQDPILKFFVVGITFYGMSTFEGPMLSVKSINALSHYTDWTIAHVHAGALGWNGFMTFGMLYWLMPLLFQTKIWSPKLMATHFWIGTIGMVLYILPIYTAGITQGLMWRAFDESGRLAYPDFIETVIVLLPLYWIRALGGTLFVAGTVLMAYNMFRTWATRPPKYDVPVHESPALSKTPPKDAVLESRLGGMVTGMGHVTDKVAQLNWHRKWERMPVKFTVFVLIGISIGGIVEAIPMFLIKANIPTIASVKPYTPLELVGRDLYVAEGCYNCHSQMIRPIFAETERYGEYSKPGESVYNRPFQWGSRRIGPDLAREGGAKSHFWHYVHMENPRQLVADSLMPAYAWMTRSDINFGEIAARVDSQVMLGVPYGPLVKEGAAEAHARAQAQIIADELVGQSGGASFPDNLQDKQIIAMIAYLQRLGTDLYQDADFDPLAMPGEAEPAETSPAASQGGAP